MLIHEPCGTVHTPPLALAEPPPLVGATIGVLDNTKPNAGVLLHRLAGRLAERTGAVVGPVVTKNAATPCEDQVLDRLGKEVRIVLTGSAD